MSVGVLHGVRDHLEGVVGLRLLLRQFLFLDGGLGLQLPHDVPSFGQFGDALLNTIQDLLPFLLCLLPFILRQKSGKSLSEIKLTGNI